MFMVILMIIDLNMVNTKPLTIGEVVDFPETFLNGTDIRKLDNIKVTGLIKLNDNSEYEYQLKITGIMVLPNSYTLEDYPYEFNIEVDEIVDESAIFFDKLKNTLDIMEILWQNIVLEVPIRVGEDNGTLKNGEGWELVSDNTKKIDPRLAKLEELLEDKKEV